VRQIKNPNIGEEQDKAKLAELYVEPAAEVTGENTKFDKETGTLAFDDRAALKLVLDDATVVDTYININQWASGWTLCDILYQSPASASAFDGGNVASANVPKFIVSNHISSIVPKIMAGIFYEDPPFLLRPLPGTEEEVVKAKTALFSQQLWEMKFEEEAEQGLDQMALLGTCIYKWGYQEYKKKTKEYVRVGQPLELDLPSGSTKLDTPESDDFKVVYSDKTISHPWIKWCDLRTVLVDPGCRYGDIRRANYVIYRDYVTYTDLDRLRGQQGYDIPSESILRTLFLSNPSSGGDNISMTLPESMRGYLQHSVPRNYKTSSDPTKSTIEILERWDNEKVIVVLCFNGHNVLIRNEANPYGVIPFYSANWRNIPDSFYGQGIGLLIGSEQLVDQGITNIALDLLAYGLQPTAVRKKGFNTPTQNVRWKQGGIIDVDEDVDKAFKFLEMPPVPPAAWTFIQQATSDAAAASGANEQVVQGAGGMGNKSTGMRSGTGAAAVVAANASRLDGPAGRFVRQVFVPWLYQMDQLNNDLLPTSVIKQVLGDTLGDSFRVDHLKLRNAKLEFEVLAGTKLGAKKEMAQFLPIMLQIFNNPTFTSDLAQAGYIFDPVAIFKSFTDAAGWKFSQSFLKKMTPEQMATAKSNTKAALMQMQLQAKNQSQQQQFEHEETLEDQKQLGKAGNEVLRQSIEQATTPEEVQGEPGGTAFGSTDVI
jgi:hypothetical protein